MRVVKVEVEPDAPPVNMIVLEQGDTVHACENCMGVRVEHPLIHKSMGHDDWCMDCNDEQFVEVNGPDAFAIYNLWVESQGLVFGVIRE